MNRNKLFRDCIYIFLFLFLLHASKVKSQISEGGKPVSFNYTNRLKSELPIVRIPVNFSVEDLIAVDEWRVSQGAPLTVSTLIDTNLDMDKPDNGIPCRRRKNMAITPAGKRCYCINVIL